MNESTAHHTVAPSDAKEVGSRVELYPAPPIGRLTKQTQIEKDGNKR